MAATTSSSSATPTDTQFRQLQRISIDEEHVPQNASTPSEASRSRLDARVAQNVQHTVANSTLSAAPISSKSNPATSSSANSSGAARPESQVTIPPMAHIARPSTTLDIPDLPPDPRAPTSPAHESPRVTTSNSFDRYTGPQKRRSGHIVPVANKPHPLPSLPPLTREKEPTAAAAVPPHVPHLALSGSGVRQTHAYASEREAADNIAGDPSRVSRETDTTTSSSYAKASSTSSAPTSVNSSNDLPARTQSPAYSTSRDGSAEESGPGEVDQLRKSHHESLTMPRLRNNGLHLLDRGAASNPDLTSDTMLVNRHLSPASMPKLTLARPGSSYSVMSDASGRARSIHRISSTIRIPSTSSRKSPDLRLASYAEMLNVPYPQPAPAPLPLDNSKLRNNVGSNAALLSTQKTLDMYRQNVKKTNDLSIQYSFAVFLISTAQDQGLVFDEPSKGKKSSKQSVNKQESSRSTDIPSSSPQELVKEAKTILLKLSNQGYPFAQYYLADGYASGLFNQGKEDNQAAFPLFVYAAKHGHAESAYRAALSYEFGWGCRKDPAKAAQFLRTAASKRHPGAMARLGRACLSGDLGEKRYREGVKWLKLATEAADTIYNDAPYQLACLCETGYGDDVFQDESYAAELFTTAAELGHPEANFRMGDAYEHGKLNCPRDPALSVHFYTGAAERGHPEAMMGLCAWYMVGADPILERDEEEAYEWARRSAETGFVKAQYAVGYFTEMGIGCRRDILEANMWYVKAADAGNERAKQRIAIIRAAASGDPRPMETTAPRNPKLTKGGPELKNDCIIM